MTLAVSSKGPKTTFCPDLSFSFKSKIQKLVDFLLFAEPSLSGTLDRHLISQVMLACSPHLLKELGSSLQRALDEIDISTMDKKKELHISHIISLIPYCYPSEGDSFHIPYPTKEGIFRKVHFLVARVLSLKIDDSVTPFKAYGLQSDSGRNLLVFLGTTFPSADGFLFSLMSDFTPFVSVGKLCYDLAFKSLNEYFTSFKEVHVYGKSLGGTLALHTLKDFESSISEVHAVAPAGLHAWDYFRPKYSKKVVIITHEGDHVSKLGFFPEHHETRIYQLNLTRKKVGLVLTHALAFSGSECVEIKQLNPEAVNQEKKRHVYSAVHVVFSCLMFTFLAAIFGCHKLYYTIHKKLK